MQHPQPHNDDKYLTNGHSPATLLAASYADEPLLPSTKLPVAELCARIHGRITAFLAEEADTEHLKRLQRQTRTSLEVIGKALDQYSLPELSLSYNGGKDCLVLLILYLCALHTHIADSPTIQSVYIVSAHPFAEVEEFVSSSAEVCSLQLSHYAKSMKAAFTEYLYDYPSVKAIFVGTRRTDPHGELLTSFDQTDHGWPDFMRVHPVIDWHYVDIWTFIRHLNIPYCKLYDMGYTSLGGTTDTHRNPVLQRSTVSGSGTPKIEFRPAYELVEDQEERLGRDWERRNLKSPLPVPASAVTEDGDPTMKV